MPRLKKLGNRSLDRETRIMRTALNIEAAGGESVADHGSLSGLGDDDHSQYVHLSTARSITAQHSFAPSVAQAPFILGANAQDQVVVGFLADKLNKSITTGVGLIGGGLLDANREISHDTGDLGDLHTNYAEHDHAETITGLWQFNTDIQVNANLVFLGARSITTNLMSNLTLEPGWNLELNPGGLGVLPSSNYLINLGSSQKKYATLHASELVVDTLVAQDVKTTIGGRVLIATSTELTSDLASVATTMYVKHNNLANGDRVYLEARGQDEWIAITSAPSGTGPYSYTVSRNLEGGGASDWIKGDSVLNTGTTGDGFIEMYANNGLLVGTGPTLLGNVRSGTTYDAVKPHWAIGNLDGLYGYATQTFGVALGRSDAEYLTIENTNGIRMFDASGNKIVHLNSDGDLILGKVATDTPNLFYDQSAGRLNFRGGTSGTEVGLWLSDDGGLTLNSQTVYDKKSAISFEYSGNLIASIHSFYSSTTRSLELAAQPTTNAFSYSSLQAHTYSSTYGAKSELWATDSLGGARIQAVTPAHTLTGAGQILTSNHLNVNGGGLVVGSGIQGVAPSTGQGRFEGGLIVGNSTDSPSAGEVRTTSHIRTDGGIYVGNRTGTISNGKIQASGDIVANSGMAFGNSGFNPGNHQLMWDCRGVSRGMRPWDGGTYYNAYVYVPLQNYISYVESGSWGGSLTGGGITWSSSIPYYAKALHISVNIKCTVAGGWVSLSPGNSGTGLYHLTTYAPVANKYNQNNGTIRVQGGQGRNMYRSYNAQGGTLTVTIRCLGYYM